MMSESTRAFAWCLQQECRSADGDDGRRHFNRLYLSARHTGCAARITKVKQIERVWPGDVENRPQEGAKSIRPALFARTWPCEPMMGP